MAKTDDDGEDYGLRAVDSVYVVSTLPAYYFQPVTDIHPTETCISLTRLLNERESDRVTVSF